MLFGALLAGAVGDIVGRRRVMLTAYAWFSIGMAITVLTTNTTTFGVMRFITGLGIGALIATTGALVAEIAPPGKKNLSSAISSSGVPLGSLLGAFLAIVLLDSIGWRGMFMIGPGHLRANRCADARQCPTKRASADWAGSAAHWWAVSCSPPVSR